MNKPSNICLSLTPILRCSGFTHQQFEVLVIPPGIEAVISLLFVYLHPGPDRLAQTLLAADGMLYFVWTLLDMLSHVVPVVQNSSVFNVLDIFIGAVSFTPILIYSIYLYRLSFRDFIPMLPRKLQPYLEISLPILLVATVAINEVSSFVGTRLGISSNSHGVDLLLDNKSLWLALNQSSLAIHAFSQFLFFLLAFCRLSRAFLNQRRIELVHSDEHHFFNGIAWITAGIILGVVETLTGFAHESFATVLTRRILRVIARGLLMFGLLQGLDVAENFENLTDELRGGASRINKRISHMLGVNSRRTSAFRRMSPSPTTAPSQSQVDACSTTGKPSTDQRVTVQYERGQAPLLQIRFSKLDFPSQGALADIVQQRRRSLSGLIPGHAGASGCMRRQGETASDEMTATRQAMLEAPRAKSALVTTNNVHHAQIDRIQSPETNHRPESGATVSDNLSIIRDLERRFPSIPPRVTGKYRGSILGDYEEDRFHVIGVSRQSSLRQGGATHNPDKEGTSVTLSPSNSIKRKPAPPLLENIGCISDWTKRPPSPWAQDTLSYPMDSPVLPGSPWEGTSARSSTPGIAGEPSAPKTRRTARDIIKRASRALSDASIRSAEWLASANSPQSVGTPLTASDVEMYRKGTIGPNLACPTSGMGETSFSGKALLPKADGASTDNARMQSSRPQIHIPINIGSAPQRTTPIPTHDEFSSGRERVMSVHGSVNLDGSQVRAEQRRATVIPAQQEVRPS